jgi:imidazoleglycerol phosphate dehydratase HisB
MKNNFCDGCRRYGQNCIYSLQHSALCPCRECIVKVKCEHSGRWSCQIFKTFKKKYVTEALKKMKETDFHTRITGQKRRMHKNG